METKCEICKTYRDLRRSAPGVQYLETYLKVWIEWNLVLYKVRFSLRQVLEREREGFGVDASAYS